MNLDVLGDEEPLPACFCRAGRTAGLPATPRPVLRAAGCRTGLRSRARLARPRTAPGPAPGPVPLPARPGGSRAHSPGGRASRRPWLCGGSAAQTAAQVSLETPAGADQGQAQPEPPAKSGCGHGRPALCGGKGPRRWGARRGPVPSPEERRCRPGPGRSAPAGQRSRRRCPVPSRPGWAQVPSWGSPAAPAGRRRPPRQRPALTRCPLPVFPVAPLRAPSAGSAAPPSPAALGLPAQLCQGGGSVPCKPLGIATVLSGFRVKGGPMLSLATTGVRLGSKAAAQSQQSHLLAARTLFCPCSSAGVPDCKAWGCPWNHPFSLLQVSLICSNSKSLQGRQRQSLEPQSGSLPTHGKAEQQTLHWQVEESPFSSPS